ncbi:hypothetical protein AB0I02_28155 [Streptomyces phaeochromogenes]
MADVEEPLDETGLRLPSAVVVRARGNRRRTRRRAAAAAAAVVAVALGASPAVLPGDKIRAARPPYLLGSGGRRTGSLLTYRYPR